MGYPNTTLFFLLRFLVLNEEENKSLDSAFPSLFRKSLIFELATSVDI